MKKIIIIFAGIVLAVAAFYFFKFTQFYNKIYTPKQNRAKTLSEKTKYNILLFGYAGGNHEGTYLTDTIMLLSVDTSKKKAGIISIPRDLWVKLPTKSNSDFYSKINAVYQMELFPNSYPDLNPKYLGTKKDAQLIKYIVSQIFGVAIDYYLAVDFEAFVKIIDTLGGIEINIDKTFADKEYPIEGKEKELCGKDDEFNKIDPFLKPGFNPEERDKLFKEKPELEQLAKYATESPELAFPCRYETVKFNQGLMKMDGITALKYARSRHSSEDGGDFGRANRQQKLLQAIKEKVVSIGFFPKIIPLLDRLQDHIRTDISFDDIKIIADKAKEISAYSLMNYVLNDKNVLMHNISDDGQYILTTKEGINQWTATKKIIPALINGTNPESTLSGSINK